MELWPSQQVALDRCFYPLLVINLGSVACCTCRVLGLYCSEVESRQYAVVDLAQSLSVEQRLVNFAKEVTQAKSKSTMKGYFPYWQQVLMNAWADKCKQQQANNQPSQQQVGQQVRQWPVNSCMVTVENFKSHINLQEQPESQRLRKAFAGVLGVVGDDPDSMDPAAAAATAVGQAQWDAGDAFKASDIPEVQRFRVSSCGGLQITTVNSVLQYQLSYNTWDKHVFAASWLQKHQHILVFGKLAEGECLV